MQAVAVTTSPVDLAMQDTPKGTRLVAVAYDADVALVVVQRPLRRNEEIGRCNHLVCRQDPTGNWQVVDAGTFGHGDWLAGPGDNGDGVAFVFGASATASVTISAGDLSVEVPVHDGWFAWIRAGMPRVVVEIAGQISPSDLLNGAQPLPVRVRPSTMGAVLLIAVGEGLGWELIRSRDPRTEAILPVAAATELSSAERDAIVSTLGTDHDRYSRVIVVTSDPRDIPSSLLELLRNRYREQGRVATCGLPYREANARPVQHP